MGGLFRGLAWAGVILCAFGAFFTLQAGSAWVPFVLIAIMCAAYLVYRWRHDRDLERVLPRGLSRLAYRSDETMVVFAWLWRGDRARHMRILRSETRGASDPDATGSGGQTCVYDGDGDTFADSGVEPRRQYHYSLFVEEARGSWSTPVHRPVLTYAQAERASIESSQAAPTWTEDRAAPVGRRDALGVTLVSDPMADPHGVDVQRARMLGDAGVLSVAGTALGGLATDLIFAAASAFAGDKAADGWEEIK